MAGRKKTKRERQARAMYEAAAARSAGRPRKEGARYPSGKLKRSSDPGYPPAQIKRLFDAGLRKAADPKFGTVLGLLFLQRRISATQFAAGVSYGAVRGRYERAIEAPRRFTQTPWFGDTSSRIQNPEPVETEPEKAARAADRVADNIAAHARLMDECGPESMILDRVCVDDILIGEDELPKLLRALDHMAVHFCLVPAGNASA